MISIVNTFMEGNLYEILRAFQFSHCSGIENGMKEVKEKSTTLSFVYNIFLDYVKDFPRMWSVIRALMADLTNI